MAAGDGLRARAVESGRQLLVRQIVGTAIRLGGVVALTRLIGPGSYGLFAAATAVVTVASTMALFGVDVHLVRTDGDDQALEDSALETSALETSALEDSAFSFLLASSVGAAIVLFLGAGLLGSWLNDDGVVEPLRMMAAVVPLVVVTAPARARFERAVRFGPLARLDLAADVVTYGVALPLALAGAGVWAPVAGFAARHGFLFGGALALARYRPRLAWRREAIAELLQFGRGYSAGRWLSMAATLVNPLLVGRWLGPVGVGQVALASRIVEQLGAVKQATLRLATAALARLRHDPARLRSAHGEGMLIQLLGSAPLYAAAAFTGPWMVPLVFGPEWAAVPRLLALLGLAATIGTLFNLHAPTLRVLGRNAPVARLQALQLVTLAAVTALLVPTVGAIGYGWARLARTVPFAAIHRDVRRVFHPDYRPAVGWLLALTPPMAAPWVVASLRPLLLLPLAAIVCTPTARANLRRLYELAAPQTP